MEENPQLERDIFARNFRRLLERGGKSQSDIVADLGITASTISDWAKGKKYPRVDKMQRLAKYFGVSISELREENAPETVILTSPDERLLLEVYRGALPVFQQEAIEMLRRHQKEKTRQPAGTD